MIIFVSDPYEPGSGPPSGLHPEKVKRNRREEETSRTE